MVVKVSSKAQVVLSLVPLTKFDKLCARLQEPNVYSSLDCTLGCHHISLSDEAQYKSAFITPIVKFEFKNIFFWLVQAPAHFQQLISEV